MGISAALDALNIIKLHIPNTSPKLVISFLEMIANRDSGNPKVVIYLIISILLYILKASFLLF
jgi:hypothetical protein